MFLLTPPAAAAPALPVAPAHAAPYLGRVTERLMAAHHSLELQCADASLGHFIPSVATLPGFRTLHRENYEVSYHLVTALGSLRRLLAGEWHPGFLALLVACQEAAAHHQARAAEAWGRMMAAAPRDPAVRGLLERLGGFLDLTAGHIAAARGITESLLGAATVQSLTAWVRQVHHGSG